MDEITEEIIRKTEKLEIEEEKFEKWNELPPEIKLECIKNLDIETRWDLRNTSKTERSLVHSQKFNINEMRLTVCHYNVLDLVLREKENSPQLYETADIEQCIECTNFILENGIFETIGFNSSVSIDKLTQWFPKTEFISAKKLIIDCEDVEGFMFWIEKTNHRLESIEAGISYLKSDPIQSENNKIFLKITNAHFFQLIGCCSSNIVSNLAQIWINNDAEIGKTFQGHLISSKNFAGFEKFNMTLLDRIISKTDRMIRIRTNDEEKHILLELGTSTFGILNGTEEFLRMTVIASKMKESEYDTSGEWIRVLAERERNEPFSSSSSEHSFDSDDISRKVNQKIMQGNFYPSPGCGGRFRYYF